MTLTDAMVSAALAFTVAFVVCYSFLNSLPLQPL